MEEPMSTQDWLEAVWNRVTRAGLPVDYAVRLVAELRDHVEEAGQTLALGSPDDIATAVIDTYRSTHWTGRHPVVALILGPFCLTILVWNLYVSLGLEFVERIGGCLDPVSLAVSHVLVFASRFVPPLAVVCSLWTLHRLSGRPRLWFYAGLVPIVFFAPSMSSSSHRRPTPTTVI
jgi:hypothetical protein